MREGGGKQGSPGHHEHPPDRLRRPRTRPGLGHLRQPACATSSSARRAIPASTRSHAVVDLKIADHAAVIAFCKAEAIGLVVVGPEAPLVAGLADDLRAAGIKVFGPSKFAAQLEGSKGFTKDICAKHGIPTAAYGRFSDRDEALAYLEAHGAPIVIKADGLAAGKGVTVAMDMAEARAAVADIFSRQVRRGRMRDRGIPRGRGGQLLRADGWKERLAARHRTGPQARRRRRHRPQHRRHGCLLAGALHDARAVRRGAGAHRQADHPRACRHGPSLRRRALCRTDPHQGRSEAHRVQLPASAIPNARC